MSERWRPDYTVDISNGNGHINNYVSVSGITIEDGGNDCPTFVRLERPPSLGQCPEKLDLLACKRAPAAVSAMIHPGILQPRKNIVGWARDPGRKQLMWQGRENGACTWQVPPLSFGKSDGVECQHPVSRLHFSMWPFCIIISQCCGRQTLLCQ